MLPTLSAAAVAIPSLELYWPQPYESRLRVEGAEARAYQDPPTALIVGI